MRCDPLDAYHVRAANIYISLSRHDEDSELSRLKNIKAHVLADKECNRAVKSEPVDPMTLKNTDLFNLEKASVLLLDADSMSTSIIVQILGAFGAKGVHKCVSAREARLVSEKVALDLVIIDPCKDSAEAFDFIHWLRRCDLSQNRYAHCLVTTGHTRRSDIECARDCGANSIVAKPLSPRLLISRILWMSGSGRGFVSTPAYIGPDRRFRFSGPPAGTNGRRLDDQSAVVGPAQQPNLSQDLIDAMMKPQRILI